MQSTQGLQLVRVQPVVDAADPARHIGAVVAEASLARDGQSPAAGAAFALETSIVPVPCGCSSKVRPMPGLTRSSFARRPASRWPRSRVSDADPARGPRRACANGVPPRSWRWLAVLLLLFTGPLLDWRRVTRILAAAAGLTVAIALLLVAARAVCGSRFARVDWLAAADARGAVVADGRVMLASPVDFILTGLLAAALLAWRCRFRACGGRRTGPASASSW